MPIPPGRTLGERWTSLALLALTLGLATWRLGALAAEDLWFDEVFSAVLASQGLDELLRRALADQTNPPGFYLALWAWARLGSFDSTWMRALPALAAIATIPAVAWLSRVLGMRPGASLVAAALAALSPLLLAMGSEVRAYAPLALASTVLLALGARVALADPSPSRAALAALAVAHVATALLHYFGVLVSLATLVATAWVARHRLREALAAAVPAVIVVAAWIVAVTQRGGDRLVGSNATWIPAMESGALLGFASQVIGTFGTGWGLWLVFAALGASVLQAGRVAGRAPTASTARARWLLVAAILPLAIVPVVERLSGRPLWVARYLIIALPPLWLLLADAVTTLRGRVRVVGLTVVLAWAGLAGPLAERARPPKPAWSRVVRSLAGSGPVTLCVNESFVGLPLRYYAIIEGVELEVQDAAECERSRRATILLTRPGTESSIATLERAGAVMGPPRALGTRDPDLDRRAIRQWQPR